ncbi:hypothetical protein JTE90_002908 [Oedothorax gibbosus]|uniref:C2H2-type domain-containing protein n=1 Tax=Oedothorax gibbosus TaxID=931172 RepID=A0AAV6UC86_9ARAC|nr:hypothetical protein JTE90_002908 [Oedothorax gibbosus]
MEDYLASNQDPNAIVEAVYDNENDLDDEELHVPINFDTNSPSGTSIIYTHSCPVCKRGFKNVAHLKCHYRRCHRDNMPFLFLMDSSLKCKICDKYFSQPSNLNAHAKTHIKKEKATPVQLYECEICFKTFPRKSSFERHCRYTHYNFFNVKNSSSHSLTYTKEEEPNNCKKDPDQECTDRSYTESSKVKKEM